MVHFGITPAAFPRGCEVKAEDECMLERQIVPGVRAQEFPNFGNLPLNFSTLPPARSMSETRVDFNTTVPENMGYGASQGLAYWQGAHATNYTSPTVNNMFKDATQAANPFHSGRNEQMYETQQPFDYNRLSSFRYESTGEVNRNEGEHKQKYVIQELVCEKPMKYQDNDMFEDVKILSEASGFYSKNENFVVQSQPNAMTPKVDEKKHVTQELISEWNMKLSRQYDFKHKNPHHEEHQKYIIQNLVKNVSCEDFKDVQILEEVCVPNSKTELSVVPSQSRVIDAHAHEQKRPYDFINHWNRNLSNPDNIKLENSPHETQEHVFNQNLVKQRDCNIFDDVEILQEVRVPRSNKNFIVPKAETQKHITKELVDQWNSNLPKEVNFQPKNSLHEKEQKHVTQEIVCDENLVNCNMLAEDVQVLREVGVSYSNNDNFHVQSQTNTILSKAAAVDFEQKNLLHEELMLDDDNENGEPLKEHKDLAIFYFEGSPEQANTDNQHKAGDGEHLLYGNNIPPMSPMTPWPFYGDRHSFLPQRNTSPHNMQYFPSESMHSNFGPSYPPTPFRTPQSLYDKFPGYHSPVQNSQPHFNRPLPQTNYCGNTNSSRLSHVFVSEETQNTDHQLFSPKPPISQQELSCQTDDASHPGAPQSLSPTDSHSSSNNDTSSSKASDVNDEVLPGVNNSPSTPVKYYGLKNRDRAMLEKCLKENNLYECPFCRAEVKTFKVLQNHFVRHTRGKQVTCPHCPHKCFNSAALKSHLISHSDDRPVTCPQCPKKWKTNAAMMKHMKECHSQDRPYHCHICPAAFKTKQGLKFHMPSHSNERPHTCLKCEAAFKSKKTLRAHVAQTHGKKSYSCELCHAKYRHKALLENHMRGHMDYKPFSCKHCPAKFKWPGGLSQHEATHGERKLECDHCQARFRHKNNLRAHMKIHMGIKAHACNKCPARFRELSSLKIHLKVHLNEKKFTCSNCSQGFRFKSHLQKHSETGCSKQSINLGL